MALRKGHVRTARPGLFEQSALLVSFVRFARDTKGQMSVELVVALPVLLIVAVIAVNLVFLFSQCAAFDRVARDAVRIAASSPVEGQGISQQASRVKDIIERSLDWENSSYSVKAHDGYARPSRFDMSLRFVPTLFGMGLKSSVFGVPLPHITHTVTAYIDPYKPSVIL